jgi:phosphate transport system permease protein
MMDTPQEFKLLSKSNNIQRLGFAGLGLLTFFTVLPILYIVVKIFVEGISAISMDFLLGFPTDGMRAGGIMPAILGTVLLTFGVTIAAVPLGIAAAVYLAEYAPITLAAPDPPGYHSGWHPSVVYGLFGLGICVFQFGRASSSLTDLRIMTIPW